jgi:hypothetical protein
LKDIPRQSNRAQIVQLVAAETAQRTSTTESRTADQARKVLTSVIT